MIRICALDFLNRDSFESDVKLADGTTIISAGEKITPELILMLYFKEIYVDNPLSDVVPLQTEDSGTAANTPITIVDYSSDETESALPSNDEEISSPFEKAEEEIAKEQAIETPLEKEETTKQEQAAKISLDNINESVQAQTQDLELDLINKNTAETDKSPKPAELDLSISSQNSENSLGEDDTSKLPKAPELDFEKEATDNPLKGGVDLGKKYSEENEIEKADEKAPVAPTLDLGDDIPKTAPEPEKPAQNFERALKFDEDVAKEIAENAVKLAKELGLSGKIVSDIEKAALICDIGLDSFSIENVKERGFEQRKAKKSYEKAFKKGLYSNEVLEIVKCHAKPYISESFNLNPIISAADILHIACLYSRYLYLGMSKEQAILKMLEQGGNEYNVFALHKFLRLMRNG